MHLDLNNNNQSNSQNKTKFFNFSSSKKPKNFSKIKNLFSLNINEKQLKILKICKKLIDLSAHRDLRIRF